MSDNNPKFSGVVTALITPFYKGKIDFLSLKKLVQQQLDNGIDGFVINGTTGESPTLEAAEVEQIFKFVKREVDGCVPLILGTGSNSTAKTIKTTGLAKKIKADAALVVCPYYNKPTQQGLVEHYSSVAKAVHMPIILYNVPGRTVISISPETVVKLSKVKNIVGVKEASGDIRAASYLIKNTNKNFLLTSGDDSTCIDFILAGGHGVISVISHIIPAEMRGLSRLARSGDLLAKKKYQKYESLNKALGINPNPIPVKMMLHLMGVIRSPELRLPLMATTGLDKAKISQTLKALDLI